MILSVNLRCVLKNEKYVFKYVCKKKKRIKKVILLQSRYSQVLGCDQGRDRERATEREREVVRSPLVLL